jgi:hypothetical protein
MSCYILSNTGGNPHMKAYRLVRDHGAARVTEPGSIQDTPDGKVYLCVLEFAHYDAVMVILTDVDMQTAKYDTGGRPKTWLLMDRAWVRGMVDDQYKDEPVLQ